MANGHRATLVTRSVNEGATVHAPSLIAAVNDTAFLADASFRGRLLCGPMLILVTRNVPEGASDPALSPDHGGLDPLHHHRRYWERVLSLGAVVVFFDGVVVVVLW